MAETNTLEDLKSVMAGSTAEGGVAVEAAALPEPKIDALGRSYAPSTPDTTRLKA